MNMTIDQFFARYGQLLPKDYKRMMRAVYEGMKVGAQMIMPDPNGRPIVIVKH